MANEKLPLNCVKKPPCGLPLTAPVSSIISDSPLTITQGCHREASVESELLDEEEDEVVAEVEKEVVAEVVAEVGEEAGEVKVERKEEAEEKMEPGGEDEEVEKEVEAEDAVAATMEEDECPLGSVTEYIQC